MRPRRLLREESERRLRIGCILDRAEGLFRGDLSAARKWLSTPNSAFGDKSPLELAKTESGAVEVEQLLGRIANWVLEIRES